MVSFLSIKKMILVFILFFFSLSFSFAGIENENIHKVKFNKMYFVYKTFKGPLSYSFKKELREVESEFSSMGFILNKPAIMFAGIKPYNNKKYDFFINNMEAAGSTEDEKNNVVEKNNATEKNTISHYLKNIDPVYYNTPVVVYVGFLVGGPDIDDSSITSIGYDFFEVSGSYQLFQIDEKLYKKNIENQAINGVKQDMDLYVSDMQIRDRVHMLNAMGKIKKEYIGMLEVYDSENFIYSFIGYYDNKLEEEERLKNEAILEEKANIQEFSE